MGEAMITAGVVLLVALVVGVVTYRIGRNNGYGRGSDEGFQVGLERGRNEPLDKIQGELDQANADLQNKLKEIEDAQRRLDGVKRTAATEKAKLERDLQSLEPITVRLERIAKTRAKIAELESEIPTVERRILQNTDKIHALKLDDARSSYRPQHGQPTMTDCEINVLYAMNNDYLLQLDDLNAKLKAANEILTELIDDLAVKRAELNV